MVDGYAGTMKALRFDCIFYYVSDLERSVEFYRDVLGFRLTSRDVVARFDLDGVLFEIVPTTHKELYGGHGNARLALQVNDIRSTTDELQRLGVACTPVSDKGTGLLASFCDPDGNEICLWQYKHLEHGTRSSIWV